MHDPGTKPLLLVVPDRVAVGAAFEAVLGHESVRAHALPALWDLRFGPLDALEALPHVRALTLDTLAETVEALLRAATPPLRDAFVAQAWAGADTRVREFYLGRSAFAVIASIFGLGRPATRHPPPERFANDQVHMAVFEGTYRLRPAPSAPLPPAGARGMPPEEAVLSICLFEPEDREAREAAGLPPGREPVIVVECAEASQALHASFLRGIARPRGWRVEGGPPP